MTEIPPSTEDWERAWNHARHIFFEETNEDGERFSIFESFDEAWERVREEDEARQEFNDGD